MSVTDYGIKPEVLEQVKERVHILFTLLYIFGIYFRSYMLKVEYLIVTITETTNSPSATMIEITYK